MDKKKAFTLAELMIVLAILGVIAAILTPIAFNAMPDENKLRFKKAYYTLQRTTDAVLNSDLYPDGDLSKVTHADRAFCNAFADMLNTSYQNCNGTGSLLVAIGGHDNAFYYTGGTTGTGSPADMDSKCVATVVDPLASGATAGSYPKFITQDGIFWWGFDYPFDPDRPAAAGEIRTDYAVICIDVDGLGPETPFSFGIRNDGKVIVGAKARDWLREGAKSSIQTEN